MRNNSLDILKGSAIIIVVALHASIPFGWLHLFQMPVFFTAAGFCFKSSASESFSSMKTYIWKRIRGLYFPCLIFSVIINILHNPLVALNLVGGSPYSVKQLIIQIIKSICFSGGGDLSGTIWFLRTMFIASVFYLLVDKITRKSKRAVVYRWILCALALGIGWAADHFKIPGHEYFNAFTVLFMYEIGRTVRQFDIKIFYPGHEKPYKAPVYLITAIVSGVALWGLDMVVTYRLNFNIIPNPFGLVAGSVIGWLFLVAVSNIIVMTPLKNALSYLGKHTLIVMLLHFSCFKIVTASQILIYNLDRKMLSSFPCLYTENCWWIAYTVVGVMIPVLIYMAYHKISLALEKNRTNKISD
jgi:fucose 4-O-acetylase-like acetyltransferase